MPGRRDFLKAAGVAGTIGLAGCSGQGGSGDGGSGDGSGQGDSGGGSGDGSGDGGSGSTDTATATPAPALQFGNGEINMNVSPSVAQEQLEAQYAPIRDHLASYVAGNYDAPSDLEATMNLANSYSTVIQALGSGTSDVAETGPFAAALGVNADMAEVVLQRKGYGSWTYKSIVVAPADSSISSLSDLEGKTVSFADRLSTSGTLYPLYNIKTEGGLSIGDLPEGSGSNADFEAVFAGGHPQSYETMVNGQAAAAGMGGFVRNLRENFDSEAKVVYEETGLPRAPIVVSPGLSDRERTALTKAFTEAPDSIYWGADGEQGTDDDLWFNAVRPADVDTYQSVIDVANELGVGSDIFEKVAGS